MFEHSKFVTHLFGTQLVRGLHEVRAHHGEGDAVAVLRRELHALLELVLEDGCVEAETTARNIWVSCTDAVSMN